MALRRAIYLEPEFALAHFALGNLMRRMGKATQAARHFDNALAIVARMDGEQVLHESEGMTAGRLARIIESMSKPEMTRE